MSKGGGGLARNLEEKWPYDDVGRGAVGVISPQD